MDIISDQGKNDIINIYPNPANDIINISCIDCTNISAIRLTSVYGQDLLMKNSNCNEEFEIDVSGFSRGIYFIIVSVDAANFIYPIILN